MKKKWTAWLVLAAAVIALAGCGGGGGNGNGNAGQSGGTAADVIETPEIYRQNACLVTVISFKDKSGRICRKSEAG